MATCEWCSTEFTPKRPERNRFCGRGCVARAREQTRRDNPPSRPVVEMTVCGCGCGEPMPVYDAQGRRRRNLYRHNPRTRKPRPCDHCGAPFAQRPDRLYCSRNCSSAARKAERVAKACDKCGAEFLSFPYRADGSRYCSKECWSDRGELVACQRCHAAFKRRGNSSSVYCSRPCARIHMIGPRAPRWRDGKSLERERLRLQPEVRVWRAAVYARDGYKCRLCGAGGYLHAHHVRPWATYPDHRFDLDNGMTLCVDCHGRVHGRRIGDRARHRDRQPAHAASERSAD